MAPLSRGLGAGRQPQRDSLGQRPGRGAGEGPGQAPPPTLQELLPKLLERGLPEWLVGLLAEALDSPRARPGKPKVVRAASLTDERLEELGLDHPLHRRRVLREVELIVESERASREERRGAAPSSAGGARSARSPLLRPSGPPTSPSREAWEAFKARPSSAKIDIRAGDWRLSLVRREHVRKPFIPLDAIVRDEEEEEEDDGMAMMRKRTSMRRTGTAARHSRHSTFSFSAETMRRIATASDAELDMPTTFKRETSIEEEDEVEMVSLLSSRNGANAGMRPKASEREREEDALGWQKWRDHRLQPHGLLALVEEMQHAALSGQLEALRASVRVIEDEHGSDLVESLGRTPAREPAGSCGPHPRSGRSLWAFALGRLEALEQEEAKLAKLLEECREVVERAKKGPRLTAKAKEKAPVYPTREIRRARKAAAGAERSRASGRSASPSPDTGSPSSGGDEREEETPRPRLRLRQRQTSPGAEGGDGRAEGQEAPRPPGGGGGGRQAFRRMTTFKLVTNVIMEARKHSQRHDGLAGVVVGAFFVSTQTQLVELEEALRRMLDHVDRSVGLKSSSRAASDAVLLDLREAQVTLFEKFCETHIYLERDLRRAVQPAVDPLVSLGLAVPPRESPPQETPRRANRGDRGEAKLGTLSLGHLESAIMAVQRTTGAAALIGRQALEAAERAGVGLASRGEPEPDNPWEGATCASGPPWQVVFLAAVDRYAKERAFVARQRGAETRGAETQGSSSSRTGAQVGKRGSWKGLQAP